MIQDLRHGARMLLKNPGFTLVAIVSIAIGVGANAAMFSVADGLVLRPLQVPRVGEVVAITSTAPRANEAFITNRLLSHPDYVDLRNRARSFKGVVAYRTLVSSIGERPDQATRTALGLAVSGNFFDVLELRPALGRAFVPDEDRVPGRDAVIVLAHETWADRFGSDPAIVGRRVRLGDTDFTVIGVAPEGFLGMHLALPPAFYVPLAITVRMPGIAPDWLERRDVRALDVRARLNPGVSLEQARQEAALIARGLEQAYPDTNRNYGLLVKTAFDARLEERGPSAPSAFMLLTVAFVVLLVACANVAGLLMSRAPAREREIALRLAIGGGRLRVVRQLITESFLIAAGGGLLGLAFASGAMVFLGQLPIVSDIGVHLTFQLDRRAVLVGIVLASASALLTSLVPAWRATRSASLTTTMRVGSEMQRPSRLWGRNAMVAAQVALSLMLLTVTVFLSRTFAIELDQPGFRTDHILLAGFEPRFARYDAQQTQAFYTLLKERVRALPGVQSVGMTSVMPLNQDYRDPAGIVPEGYQLPRGTESLVVLSSRIDEGYLGTMGIRVVRGRGILESDTAGSPRVVVINAAMASRYWPQQDPIGKRIRFVDREGQPWAEVVGVTANSKFNWIGEAPAPLIYLAQRQDPGARSTLLVHSSTDAASLAAPLRQVVSELDPNMPIAGVRTMEEFFYGNATGVVRGLTQIVGGMGTMGMALAMVGLYGLVAYAVARRTREIGIRMAVGARPGIVLRSVLGHGLVLSACGIVLGVAGCVGISGLLRGVFPSTAGIDVMSYVYVVPLLVVVTLVAAFVPARRAAHIDPLLALRSE